MKSFTVQKYLNAGCLEMAKPAMFAVWGLTGGKVCDTGCHAFRGGNCPAYRKLITVPVVVKAKKYAITNKDFAKNSASFQEACSSVSIQPTARQASKFRRGTGLAYKTMILQKNKKSSQLQP